MQATGPSVEALPTVRRRKKRLWIWIYFLFRPSYHFALFSLFLCLLSISVIPFSPFYPFSLFHSSFYCLDPRWFCHHLKVGPTGCQRCRPQSFKKWLIVYSNICNFKPLRLVFFGKRHLITTMMPFNESGNYSRERFWSAKKIRLDAVEEMSSRLKTTDWCGRWYTSGLIWSQRHALSNEPSDLKWQSQVAGCQNQTYERNKIKKTTVVCWYLPKCSKKTLTIYHKVSWKIDKFLHEPSEGWRPRTVETFSLSCPVEFCELTSSVSLLPHLIDNPTPVTQCAANYTRCIKGKITAMINGIPDLVFFLHYSNVEWLPSLPPIEEGRYLHGGKNNWCWQFSGQNSFIFSCWYWNKQQKCKRDSVTPNVSNTEAWSEASHLEVLRLQLSLKAPP